jgi:hypothetical protein
MLSSGSQSPRRAGGRRIAAQRPYNHRLADVHREGKIGSEHRRYRTACQGAGVDRLSETLRLLLLEEADAAIVCEDVAGRVPVAGLPTIWSACSTAAAPHA